MLDWAALAAFPGTLVFYMGVGNLPKISSALIDAGRDPDEPAAVVERGTLPGQRTVVADAGRAAGARRGRGDPPAVDHPRRPGGRAARRAGLDRAPPAARAHRRRDPRAGAGQRPRPSGCASSAPRSIEAPAIRIEPLAAELGDLAAYDLICLTSPNGVARLFELVRDARALAGATVAAIGPGTARALREHGIEADVVPERFVAEGLVEALADVPVRRALVARAREARDVLPDALRERGADVDVVALYETVAGAPTDAERAAALGADYVTFTSSSTVRFFLEAAGRPGPDTRIVSIGPVTSQTLRDAGLEPHVEAAASRRRRPRRRAARGRRAVIVTFLSDYGTKDEFVGVCHAVIARIAPGRPRGRPRPRRAAPRRARRRRAPAQRAALPARGRPPRRRRPRGRRRAPRRGGARRRRPALRRPRQRPALARARAGRAARSRRSTWRARRTGSSRWPRPSTAATCSRRPPRTSPRAARWPTPGDPLAPDELVTLELPGAAARRRRRADAPRRSASTATATCSSTPRTRTSPARRCASARRCPSPGARRGWPARSPTAPPGELLVYEDAWRCLALAVNRGDAAAELGLAPGADVRIEPA